LNLRIRNPCQSLIAAASVIAAVMLTPASLASDKASGLSHSLTPARTPHKVTSSPDWHCYITSSTRERLRHFSAPSCSIPILRWLTGARR
jgi:hypothetical protein